MSIFKKILCWFVCLPFFILAASPLFISTEAHAAETVKLPIFPEYQAHYLVIQNSVVPSEYFLFLSSEEMHVYERGSDYLSVKVTVDGALDHDARLASYRWDSATDNGWVLVEDLNRPVGSHLNKPYWSVQTKYPDEVSAAMSEHIGNTHFSFNVKTGECSVGYNAFTSVVFTDMDMSIVSDSDNPIWGYSGSHITWLPESDNWWDHSINLFNGTFRNTMVWVTTLIIPLVVLIIALFAFVRFIRRFFFGKDSLVSPQKKKKRRSKRLYKPSMPRSSRGSYSTTYKKGRRF